MRSQHALVLVAALATTGLVAAAPRVARAQRGLGPPPALVYTEVGALAAGVATDAGITVSLLRQDHVSLWWSIPGVVLWSAQTVLLTGLAISTGGLFDDPTSVAFGVFTLGSLGWSIYGIVRHAPPPPVAVTPTALRGPTGHLVPALTLAGHF